MNTMEVLTLLLVIFAARAFMENRLNVSFEDVKCVALPVLRHRILLSFDAVSEGITEDAVIGQILTEKEQGLYA